MTIHKCSIYFILVLIIIILDTVIIDNIDIIVIITILIVTNESRKLNTDYYKKFTFSSVVS